MKRLLLFVVVLMLAVGLALWSGLYAISLASRLRTVTSENKESIKRIEKLTDQVLILTQANAETARDFAIVSCTSNNILVMQIRSAIKDSLLALAPKGMELTPEQLEIVAAYNAKVDAGLQFRDCSDAGIDTFIDNPPKDPAKG